METTEYESHIFSNGLRMIHQPLDSRVSYCGFAIDAGTRDEFPSEYGMAHFVEHMLFKGTRKRKAGHILNRMENVGGELNAYTTKEETFIYCVFLEEDLERAIELLTDLVFHSLFPEREIEKERNVILDEINSYRDNPSELIFDDFENLLFEGHEIGHNILGDENTLQSFTGNSFREFHSKFYIPSNIIFFSAGKSPFSKIRRLTEKYTSLIAPQSIPRTRKKPSFFTAKQLDETKELYQTHVLMGTQAYESGNKNSMGLYLLNNILGGPGMNSRLNLILREKYGLVYNVESNLISYTDTGIFSIYFGCEEKQAEKCINLVNKELKLIRDNKLSDSKITAAKKQLKGQLGIARDNRESVCLSMGKNFLHYNKFNSLQTIYEKIDRTTPSLLLEIANEIITPNRLSQIIYR